MRKHYTNDVVFLFCRLVHGRSRTQNQQVTRYYRSEMNSRPELIQLTIHYTTIIFKTILYYQQQSMQVALFFRDHSWIERRISYKKSPIRALLQAGKYVQSQNFSEQPIFKTLILAGSSGPEQNWTKIRWKIKPLLLAEKVIQSLNLPKL